MMQPIFYGTVAPLLAWFTFKKLVLDPYEANKRAAEKEKLRDANLARVALARTEAQASVDLMKERFSRIRTEEINRSGLVIILALYGKILDGTLTHSGWRVDTGHTFISLIYVLNFRHE